MPDTSTVPTSVVEWVATGLASAGLGIAGVLYNMLRSEKRDRENAIKELWTTHTGLAASIAAFREATIRQLGDVQTQIAALPHRDDITHLAALIEDRRRYGGD